jgi:hypothetical protein
MSIFKIKATQWDNDRYSFLSKAQQGFDTIIIIICSIEFLLFLLLDQDDYTTILDSGMISMPFYTLLLITYVLERIIFGVYRVFINGKVQTDDIADGLIVLFMGPYYYFRSQYPYETRKSLFKRAKLQTFGLSVNIIKLAMLIHLTLNQKNQNRQIVVVCATSVVELLGTARNVIQVLVSDVPEIATVPTERYFIVIKK